MVNIVHKELSYKIIGLLFEVHNKLGSKYQEKYYQRAFELLLIREKISYKKELAFDLVFNDQKIGKNILDFLIENKIIIELKAEPRFSRDHFKQVLSYLKTTGLELGILVNFRGSRLVYKRILNSDLKHSD